MIRAGFAFFQLLAAVALAFALAYRVTIVELEPDATVDESGEVYADWVAEKIVEEWNSAFVANCFPPRLRDRLDRKSLADAFAMHEKLGALLGKIEPKGSVSRSRTPSGTPIDLGNYECHIEFENGFLVLDLETARVQEKWWLIGLGMSAPRVMNFDEFDTDTALRTDAANRSRRRTEAGKRNEANDAGKVAKDLEALYGDIEDAAK